MKIEVHLHAPASDWGRRNSAGLVPDPSPYGLDQLPHEVSFQAPDAPTALSRLALRATGFDLATVVRPARPDTDVILCWDEVYGVPQLLGSRLRKGPPVASGVIWLTDPASSARAGRVVARRLLSGADLIWALSSAQLPVLERHWGVPADRLAHLRFGVDTSFWRPGPEPASQAHTPSFLVGSAGNDRHRDYRLLVTAMRSVRHQIPKARLEVATWQPLPDIPDLVQRRGTLSHTDLRDTLYRRAQVVAVVVRPNLHVSGITTVLEAMACGRAVVCTRTPGIEDYVTENENVILTRPGDQDDLTAALVALLLDDDRRHALAEAGRRHVSGLFTTSRMVKDLAGLLDRT